MANIKISADFWKSCNEDEQEYIKKFALKIGLRDCKMVIREARKQLSVKYNHIGAYAVNTESGTLFFTGEDTRKFKSL